VFPGEVGKVKKETGALGPPVGVSRQKIAGGQRKQNTKGDRGTTPIFILDPTPTQRENGPRGGICGALGESSGNFREGEAERDKKKKPGRLFIRTKVLLGHWERRGVSQKAQGSKK